jgi:hypothetical protein
MCAPCTPRCHVHLIYSDESVCFPQCDKYNGAPSTQMSNLGVKAVWKLNKVDFLKLKQILGKSRQQNYYD